MDSGTVAVIVAVISLAGTATAAYLSSRAQKVGATVQEKAALFEGYDEFVSHLRARIDELEGQLGNMINRAQEAAEECDKCRAALQAARADYYNLTRITRAMRDQMGLPSDFGLLPIELVQDEQNKAVASSEESTTDQ